MYAQADLRLCWLYIQIVLLVMIHVGVCCAAVSVPCSLVVTCWKRAGLLAVVCVVFSCVLSLFQMFPGPHPNLGRDWHCGTNLSRPVNCFTDHSKAVLLLWITFVICVSCFSGLICLFNAALWSPAGRGLASWLSCVWCFVVFCHFPMWYPGSCVVLDCIDS